MRWEGNNHAASMVAYFHRQNIPGGGGGGKMRGWGGERVGICNENMPDH